MAIQDLSPSINPNNLSRRQRHHEASAPPPQPPALPQPLHAGQQEVGPNDAKLLDLERRYLATEDKLIQAQAEADTILYSVPEAERTPRPIESFGEVNTFVDP